MKTTLISSNSQINFTSGIKIVPRTGLTTIGLDNAKFVTAPYTADVIARGKQAFTNDVATCCSGGFLVRTDSSDEFDVIFFHLIPKKHFKDNGAEKKSSSIAEIHKRTQELLGKDKIVQAFLFGSKKRPNGDSRLAFIESQKLFKKMENYIKRVIKVPFSKLKGFPVPGNNVGELSYNGKKDLWTVFATNLKDKNNVLDYFDEVALAHCDQFVT